MTRKSFAVLQILALVCVTLVPLALIFVVPQPAHADITDGLVGHWTFDGADVTDKVYDRSGQANNGYFVGGATSSAKTIGKLGQALTFDGATNFVDTNAGDGSVLDLSNELSICAWIKPTTLGASEAIVANNGSLGGEQISQYQLELNNNGAGSVGLAWSNDADGQFENYDTAAGAVAVSQWSHVCAVRVDGATRSGSTISDSGMSGISA